MATASESFNPNRALHGPGPHGRLHGRGCACQRFVLPDPDYHPAFRGEGIRRHSITLVVTPKLRLPVVAVRTRRIPVSRARVPEASVNEDRDLRAGKSEVWPHNTGARPQRWILAISEASSVKLATETDLGSRASLAIPSHDLRDGFAGRNGVLGVAWLQSPPSRSFLPSASDVSLRNT
jgi:hypothetical protein